MSEQLSAAISSSITIDGQPRAQEPALRVLVVDDDEDSCALMKEAVSRLGHRVVGAADGAAAWAKLQAEQFDVILSDWMMPHMTGMDLCRNVRTRDPSQYTYFVFMTGLDDKAHFLEGMRAGADDYLTKPVDLEELNARLLSATRVVKVQRTLAQRNAMLLQESALSFEEARTDTLTQASNRLRLREDLGTLPPRATRDADRRCAAFCDIDLFKTFNDTYGHLAGDDALRRVAGAIRDTLRKADKLYRYGGEEFLAILPNQSLTEAARVMDRVRNAVEHLAIAHEASPSSVITISVGIAERSMDIGDTDSCDAWLERADAALYRAKQKGRNRIELDVPIAR